MDARGRIACTLGIVAAHAATAPVLADAFSAYAPAGSFNVPAGTSSYDVLVDGRIVAMVDANVYVESAVGSGSFTPLGALPGADIGSGSFSTAFVRVSPDGTHIAVGNNSGAAFNNPQVGVFDLSGLTGNWFNVEHFDAEWFDNTSIVLTAPGVVTSLDTTSDPANPVTSLLINNVGGAPAGITFDANGNLYTGNGFDGPGPSDTGWIKAFPPSAWQGTTGRGLGVADFEASGTLVADVLSAGFLGFDGQGNLHVGGGDLFGGSGDNNYGGLVRQTALATALSGGGLADSLDPEQLRRFDPDPGPASRYDVNYNPVTGALLMRSGSTIFAFAVPEPVTLVYMFVGLWGLGVGGRRRSVRG